ncbi:MAG: two-component system nitrate/nitrite response regulator NarL [Paracoccaceae bacterium]|jgi:two-component system nitrate/nitrite response regulator NarL
MRLLIADDHDLVRDTLAAFLKAEGDFEVTVTEDLHKACDLITNTEAPFDLVLLDYGMPGMDGLNGLGRALELSKGKPVALMSGIAPKAVAKEAMEAGAVGFLPKTMGAKSLVNAIRFMAMGEKFVPVDFLSREETEVENPLAKTLTARELDVLSGLCRGLANKEIARELDLQEVTIKLHVKTLCRKLDAKNRTHAAMIAKEAGVF